MLNMKQFFENSNQKIVSGSEAGFLEKSTDKKNDEINILYKTLS